MFGALPGGLLLVLAGLDCGAGAGDGIVLIQLDLLLLLDKVVIAFGISLMAMGIFSVVLLCLKKGRKDLRLPYMPFLWLGCLGALGICGIV